MLECPPRCRRLFSSAGALLHQRPSPKTQEERWWRFFSMLLGPHVLPLMPSTGSVYGSKTVYQQEAMKEAMASWTESKLTGTKPATVWMSKTYSNHAALTWTSAVSNVALCTWGIQFRNGIYSCRLPHIATITRSQKLEYALGCRWGQVVPGGFGQPLPCCYY